jgi:hypothetical protein
MWRLNSGCIDYQMGPGKKKLDKDGLSEDVAFKMTSG